MNIVIAVLIVVVVTAVAVAAMLLVRRNAPDGSYFHDGDRAAGTLRVWAEPYTELRVPKIFNLRTDPYERADITSNTYYDWILDHAWVAVPMQSFVFGMLQTMAEFPPRQKPASVSLDQVLERLQTGIPGS